MRFNSNVSASVNPLLTVYLNGKKEPNAVEVYVPGNALEGRGYVVRLMERDGKAIPTFDIEKPLPAGQYDSNGALCEKVYGQVRIEIAECSTEFEDN